VLLRISPYTRTAAALTVGAHGTRKFFSPGRDDAGGHELRRAGPGPLPPPPVRHGKARGVFWDQRERAVGERADRLREGGREFIEIGETFVGSFVDTWGPIFLSNCPVWKFGYAWADPVSAKSLFARFSCRSN